MKENLKQQVHKILDSSDHSNSISKLFNIFLITLIVLNTLAVTVETVKSIEIVYRDFFHVFEVFSVIVFTIEYLLRIWSITASHKYSNRIYGRIKFIFTGSALIDLFAILPFYLPMLIGFDLRF
jgi:voltage-gated potassium channel